MVYSPLLIWTQITVRVHTLKKACNIAPKNLRNSEAVEQRNSEGPLYIILRSTLKIIFRSLYDSGYLYYIIYYDDLI